MHEKKKKKEETNIYISAKKESPLGRRSVRNKVIAYPMRFVSQDAYERDSLPFSLSLSFFLSSIHPSFTNPLLFNKKKKKIAPRTLSLERSRTVRTKLRQEPLVARVNLHLLTIKDPCTRGLKTLLLDGYLFLPCDARLSTRTIHSTIFFWEELIIFSTQHS